jgi:nucleoside triphosphatase
VGLQDFINDDSFQEDKHFIFIDYVCRTDTEEVKLNDESESYCWVSLSEIDNYELGGYTRNLLREIRDMDSSSNKREILYNYVPIESL